MLTGGGVILSNHRGSCQKTVWSDGRDARKLSEHNGRRTPKEYSSGSMGRTAEASADIGETVVVRSVL